VSVTFSCVLDGDHHAVLGALQANFANQNAQGLLDLLGFDATDLYGRVEHDGLPDLRRRIIKALNSDRSSLVTDGYELPPGHAGVAVLHDHDGVARIERRGPRVVVGGCSDEQVVRRLRALPMREFSQFLIPQRNG